MNGTTESWQYRLRLGDEHRRQLGDDNRVGDRRGRRCLQRPVVVTGGIERDQRRCCRSDRRNRPCRRGQVLDSNFVPGQHPASRRDQIQLNGDDNPVRATSPTSTAADFHPGAFDIQEFQVYDSGSDVTFRLAQDARPSARRSAARSGAQLVDVYVHVPGASPTSTAAAAATRNFYDRARIRLEPAHPGARLRAALRRRDRRNTRNDRDQSERDFSLHHHLQRSEIVARDTGPRLGLRGRPHWSGRLQQRPGKELCANATILRVRRLRNSQAPTLTAPQCKTPPPSRKRSTCSHTAFRSRPVNRGLDYTLGPVVLQGVSIPVAAPRDQWPAPAGESSSRQNENGIVTSESEGVRHGRVDGRYA